MIKTAIRSFVFVILVMFCLGMMLRANDVGVTVQQSSPVDKEPNLVLKSETLFGEIVGRAKVTPEDAYVKMVEFREAYFEDGGWMERTWDSPSYILAGHYVFSVKNKFFYPLKGYAVDMETGEVSTIKSDILLLPK